MVNLYGSFDATWPQMAQVFLFIFCPVTRYTTHGKSKNKSHFWIETFWLTGIKTMLLFGTDLPSFYNQYQNIHKSFKQKETCMKTSKLYNYWKLFSRVLFFIPFRVIQTETMKLFILVAVTHYHMIVLLYLNVET